MMTVVEAVIVVVVSGSIYNDNNKSASICDINNTYFNINTNTVKVMLTGRTVIITVLIVAAAIVNANLTCC